MKNTRKCAAIKRKNQADSQKETGKEGMSTSFLSTSDDRTTIKLPKSSKIYEYLHVDNRSPDTAAWKKLDWLLAVAMQKEEDFVIAAWEDFVRRISFFYPQKRLALDMLRPLILRAIIRGEKLSEDFWEELRKEIP